MNHFVGLVFANLSPNSVTFCTIFFEGWPVIPGKKQKPWPISFLHACPDQKAAPATQKHRENTLEESVFPSAEHSNFPKQPREKAEVQPTDQLCGLSFSPHCREELSLE